jgi:hypothetical protein
MQANEKAYKELEAFAKEQGLPGIPETVDVDGCNCEMCIELFYALVKEAGDEKRAEDRALTWADVPRLTQFERYCDACLSFGPVVKDCDGNVCLECFEAADVFVAA